MTGKTKKQILQELEESQKKDSGVAAGSRQIKELFFHS